MMTRLAIVLAITAATLAAQGDLAGTYKGTWAGGSADGEFKLSLARNGDEWKADVEFTLGGAAVPTKIAMLRVDGSKFEVKYDFDLAGNKLQSHLEGEVKDGELMAKYKTKALGADADVDAGTCKAKRQ